MITLSTDNASVNSIINDIKRLDAAGKKSVHEATKWAGIVVCTSLGPQTKVSPKMRKVVRKAVIAGSKPVEGVMMYIGGKETFVPLNSEDARVRFMTAKSGKELVQFLATGKFVTKEFYLTMKKSQLIRQTDRMIIRMNGLARRSWKWLQGRVKRGGYASDGKGGRNVRVGNVTWFGDNITIHNKLAYIQDTLVGGAGSVDVALENAAKSFKWKVDQLLGLHEIKTK
jgi:hypothetical protein